MQMMNKMETLKICSKLRNGKEKIIYYSSIVVIMMTKVNSANNNTYFYLTTREDPYCTGNTNFCRQYLQMRSPKIINNNH